MLNRNLECLVDGVRVYKIFGNFGRGEKNICIGFRCPICKREWRIT